MQAENSLRRRLVAAHALLAIVIGGVFAAAGCVIVEALEYELIDVRLTRAAARFVPPDQGEPPSVLSDLVFVPETDFPPGWRKLAPGLHQLDQGERTLQVMVFEHGGRRYAAIDDVTDFERNAHLAFAALGIAFFCGVMLAFAIARASANRIIAPLTALAGSAQRGDLRQHPQLFEAADEIGMLARALDAHTSQVNEFLVRERLFTADVSHELRTPLAVILGAAELLETRVAGRPELREAVERIRRTAADTSVRVSALLQLARSPDKLECRSFDLRGVIEQELERCAPIVADKPVALEVNAPREVRVHANPELASIAIGNLLRNACDYTQRGFVRLTLTDDALVIEDSGPGVPQAVRSRLFEPFVRGSDESPGSGLGLSIVKRVADHLSWSIRLDEPSQGSRFTIEFGDSKRPVLTPL